jgi:K+-transporting ATPase ATPase C chain
MTSQSRPALVMFALLTLLTGLAYPLAVTVIAQVTLPAPANGSVVMGPDGAAVGSNLIGQDFTEARYFWGRPSATAGAPYTPYDGQALTGSTGSNLGPLSAALRTAVEERVAALAAADPGNTAAIPADLVTASASGLDPSISVAAALYQAPRVARVRGIDEATVHDLIAQKTQGRWVGVFGEPRVNGLELNLALDTVK